MEDTNLHYHKDRTPVENIESFFNSVKMLYYEWVEIIADDKPMYFLVSAWKNDVGLQNITLNFSDCFYNNLIEISMNPKSQTDYLNILKECKLSLNKINHYYRPSFTDILIIRKSQNINEKLVSVEYNLLSAENKESIQKCYELLIVLFQSLDEIVKKEIIAFERTLYIRSNSTYKWSGKKNEISELALGILLSGSLKNKDGTEIKKSIFARELAAFLGADKLTFDEDIRLLSFRTSRKSGNFFEICRKNVSDYYIKRVKTTRHSK